MPDGIRQCTSYSGSVQTKASCGGQHVVSILPSFFSLPRPTPGALLSESSCAPHGLHLHRCLSRCKFYYGSSVLLFLT